MAAICFPLLLLENAELLIAVMMSRPPRSGRHGWIVAIICFCPLAFFFLKLAMNICERFSLPHFYLLHSSVFIWPMQ
jgi:hypothetical protein